MFGCTLLVDLGAKTVVSGSYGLHERHEMLSFLAIVPTHNPGVSFTFIGGGVQLPVYVLAGAVALVAITMATHPPPSLPWLPIGLMLGGACGNLFELLHHGYATDFLQVGGLQLVFNLADVSILLGGILLYLHLIRRRMRPIRV